MLNILRASIYSKTLFIIVDESIDIFFPILQLGCFNAIFGLIFDILLLGVFKKGPPDAVIIICFTSDNLSSLIKLNIEKCSESIGINLVLFFFNLILIKFHPQIIDSLFAMSIFLVKGITSSVGFKPFITDIEFTQ